MTAPYWHDDDYVRAVAGRLPLLRWVRASTGHPLAVIDARGVPHIVTLPGFPSPTANQIVDVFHDVVSLAGVHGAPSAFLQVRGDRDPDGILDAPVVWCDQRTMAVVDVVGDDESIIAGCRRDTRSRLRRATRDGMGRRAGLAPEFARWYDALGIANEVSTVYRYDHDEIAAFVSGRGPWAVTATDGDGRAVGGAVLGHVDDQSCDYILSAYDTTVPNGGRMVLFQSLLDARDRGYASVNLGGGVREDDPLFSFKTSFGARAAPFWNLKIVLDADRWRAAHGTDPHTVDHAARFPPG